MHFLYFFVNIYGRTSVVPSLKFNLNHRRSALVSNSHTPTAFVATYQDGFSGGKDGEHETLSLPLQHAISCDRRSNRSFDACGGSHVGASPRDQWFCFNRYIGYITPTILYFHRKNIIYWIKVPQILFNLALETKSLLGMV